MFQDAKITLPLRFGFDVFDDIENIFRRRPNKNARIHVMHRELPLCTCIPRDAYVYF